jgi:1-deoxyxylulose-5-phosphate synthase
MNYRFLGRTGLEVSEIALGTVELGMDYGFRGSAHYQKPPTQEAVRILHQAIESGINLIDTARVYGPSEQIIGEAFKDMSHRPYIAGKVLVPERGQQFTASGRRTEEVLKSIETSLKALQVDTIDLMLIHNATRQSLADEEMLSCLDLAREQGKIRFLGASTYKREDSLEVLKNGRFEVLEVPLNVLDQRMVAEVLPEASQRGVGVLARSAFLRGVLTPQIETLPERLNPLREAAFAALKTVGAPKANITDMALRFCLGFSEVSTVIICVRSSAELQSNLAAAIRGPYPPETRKELRRVSVADEKLIDPSYWQDLI